MSAFVCLIGLEGTPARLARCQALTAFMRTRGWRPQWLHAEAASFLIGDGGLGSRARVERSATLIGVGAVRLDNSPEIAKLAGLDAGAVSDLHIVLSALERCGPRIIAQLLGDFAFVVSSPATRTVLAARDAFGVRRLYHAARAGVTLFSSRADLLAQDEHYDLRTLLDFSAVCSPDTNRTAFADVRALPPGSLATLSQGQKLHISEFWSPEAQGEREIPAGERADACRRFRSLFEDAVQCRLPSGTDAWCQLSGGLDSSSVVSMASSLCREGRAPRGVGGTVTWVDLENRAGDERAYSNALVAHLRLRNEVVLNDWWEEDDAPPPLTDAPDSEYPLYVRDRRIASLIGAAGGRVLLTGFGSDHYLLGNMLFFADWIANGRAREAVHEMVRRAALGRVSFWNLAFQNALIPLLPAPMRRAVVPGGALPAWIRKDVARRAGAGETDTARSYSGRWGSKYRDLVMLGMRGMAAGLGRHQLLEEHLDVRHPFLYRPLVEFGLSLPADMCVQPHARKWVLREAMRGVLPDSIRQRVGKGCSVGGIVASLIKRRALIDRLFRDPVLAQLGCVEPQRLRAAYEMACRTGEESLVTGVLYTFALETWLRARSGRWTAADSATSTASSSAVPPSVHARAGGPA